ncbi:MAG: hypothetical protein ABSE54_03555 [Smithella sp.]|jgi:hypothetical protein
MGGKELEQREGPRRVMVNSDEDLIEALKKINETLQVKKKIICKRKGEMNNGRHGQINGTLETEG